MAVAAVAAVNSSFHPPRRLDKALQWACRLQADLLALPWPEELLELRDCAPVYSPSSELLYRGLRVRVGVAWGVAGGRAWPR